MTIWGRFVLVSVGYVAAQGFWLANELAIRGNPLVDPPCVQRPALPIPAMIVEAALREGINPWPVLWLAWEESKYIPELVSNGNYGVFQLNRCCFPENVRLSVPLNIAAGVGYYAEKLRKHRSWARARAGYRSGN